MELPNIAIQICTFNRYDEIRKTVEALQELIIYPPDKITLYVCDDSSPGSYLTKLKRLKIFKYWNTVFLTTPERGGWGKNVNNGLRQIKEEIIFFVEDDYVLTHDLDLRVGVALLSLNKYVGMVRYRGTAGTHIVYHGNELDISDYGLMYMAGACDLPDRLYYLQLDMNSPSLYVYSHGAHLKTKQFHRVYGLYPEDRGLANTEESYAHMVKDRMRANPDTALGITIFPEWIPMRWDHIGISYQGSDEDINN